MSETTMPNWLMQRAKLTPDRVAVETENDTVSFLTLYQQVTEIARQLWSIGVRENDKVAFISRNSLELVRFYHALAAVGAVGVPLNNRLSAGEQSWQLEDSCAKWLICDEHFQSRGLEIMKGKSSVSFLTMAQVRDQPQAEARLQNEFDLDKPCTIIYTSGTTGNPKGVILTYGNHWWSAAGSMLNLGLETADKWLCCVPLFHVSGLSILMKNVIYGMPIVLQEKFNPREANRFIYEEGVTMISVVANMLKRMLEDLGDRKYPESFRCMLLGGGPVPQPLLSRCVEKRIPVFQTYGLTETASQMVTLTPEFMFEKAGSAGKPLFPGRVRIVGSGKDLNPGEAGEIVVKGLNVTPGYWRRPEATNKAIRDGWLFTGDIGYLDQDGFLYVLDRRKDLIISGGENVYPAEIESVLLGHPSVDEAGVIGVKDDTWGQVPYAFVKVKDGFHFSEEEILDYCRKYLAKYKLPRHVQRIDCMPRNASRKLMRRKLSDFLPEPFID
ncbi:o-succinylbenzoate--CoA ligase [Sporolactobacillus sp. THM7-4]|nr:o-succinylbenzoate--CoA ligase [Sporolactobacillus sp. THM7-4]